MKFHINQKEKLQPNKKDKESGEGVTNVQTLIFAQLIKNQ